MANTLDQFTEATVVGDTDLLHIKVGTGAESDKKITGANAKTAFATDAPEGTAVVSTGETVGKVLTADGDDTSSWQDAATGTPEGTAILSTGETGGTKYLREDGDGTCSWQTPAGGGSSPLTTKGDVYGFSTADARLPVGTDDQVLTADSSEALGVKWAAASGGGKTLIETIDNSSTAGDFDFNSIPSGYNRLIIKGEIRSDVSADNDEVLMFANADTTVANYHYAHIIGYNGTGYNIEGSEPRIVVTAGGTSPSSSMCSIVIEIENPDSSNLKLFSTRYGSYRGVDAIYMGTSVVSSAVTAAITRLRIQTDNDPTDQLFGILRLYGEM